MTNPYVDLCVVTQAIRRDSERLRGPLITALGVAASAYTHQLANALRVLTDLRVRHLLADEVGLGKTVQALMILNALRCARPELRALIIVPDRLVPQWRDELLTRAHIVPTDQDIDAVNEADLDDACGVRLAWEALLKKPDDGSPPRWTLADIDPSRYDVLIVDELHKLITPLQEHIIQAAVNFDHLLILTATPSFQDPSRHAQLFAALEPERCAIARWGVLNDAKGEHAAPSDLSTSDDISKWPEWAARAVVSALLERDRLAAEACENETARGVTAQAACAYRRIIRTRRADYSTVLPRRQHLPITTEPLEAEVKRQALMWSYFNYLGDLTRKFDPILLAKRVILSPPSLEQRVDFLRRKKHERNGILERVKPLVHRSQGDSRLDALIDLLGDIWRANPQERVLIAAQDSLTVDYLFEQVQAKLPWIGPLAARVPLRAARVRQGMTTDAFFDLAGRGNETNENIEAFQGGEAQVLFVPEAAQVGLNLQCARVLVLYSVPWRPEEVEQWIGRLDRIGNVAAFSADEAKTIDVYTITQRGLVDDKVVSVLQRFCVFERGVNLDGEHLEEVARRIEQAALKQTNASWDELGAQTATMAAEDEIRELSSPLKPWLPWSVEWAKAVRKGVEHLAPIEPTLQGRQEHARAGLRAWDYAGSGLVELLRRTDDYYIKAHEEPSGYKFKTLWYKFGELGIYKKPVVRSRVIFSFGADPSHERSPKHAHAFITRRDQLSAPPLRSVMMKLNEETVRRPLRFLSFGDPLHDELVRGWSAINPGWLSNDAKLREAQVIEVVLPSSHALFDTSTPGLYLVRLSTIDPAEALLNDARKAKGMERLLRIAAEGPEGPARQLTELIKAQERRLRCALEADARWLRSQLPGGLRVDALRRAQPGQWESLDEGSRRALFDPTAVKVKKQASSSKSSLAKLAAADVQDVTDALAALRARDADAAKDTWSERFPAFDQALSDRDRVLDAEASDVEELIRLEMRDAERRGEQARAQGNASLAGRADAALKASKALLDITIARMDERHAWLMACRDHARAAPPIEKGVALLRIVRGL